MSKSKPYSIYDSVAMRVFAALVRRRDNAFYRVVQANRYAAQFTEEGVCTYRYIDNDQWMAYHKRLSRSGVKYKTFPCDNGARIVVSSDGDTEMPYGEERVELIKEWIANVPVSTRITSSKGFGGKYAKAQPRRNSEPGRYSGVAASIPDIVSVFDSDEVKYIERDEGANLLGMSQDEAAEYMDYVSKYALYKEDSAYLDTFLDALENQEENDE